ncbi:MAG: hypothetical protein HZT40_08940 [Candidatus Thiothrix singaporensis]|uniref:Uncharacterized protein n=1 Tax=Candidatus Thiothrix singaporensis TaxID=2799669 RepID=A0A7L6ARB9_9GAMM|nr:MAG: hypothetical protein HZT40_08940 [Candidatus Thiothrix singaporensis]
MQTIQLSLSIDEVNLILESLGQQPYRTVHQLIANIHQQAQMQLQPPASDKPAVPSANKTNHNGSGQ